MTAPTDKEINMLQKHPVRRPFRWIAIATALIAAHYSGFLIGVHGSQHPVEPVEEFPLCEVEPTLVTSR